MEESKRGEKDKLKRHIEEKPLLTIITRPPASSSRHGMPIVALAIVEPVVVHSNVLIITTIIDEAREFQ
jgi:hypothetical protein